MLIKQLLVLTAAMLILAACNQAQKNQAAQKASEETKEEGDGPELSADNILAVKT